MRFVNNEIIKQVGCIVVGCVIAKGIECVATHSSPVIRDAVKSQRLKHAAEKMVKHGLENPDVISDVVIDGEAVCGHYPFNE